MTMGPEPRTRIDRIVLSRGISFFLARRAPVRVDRGRAESAPSGRRRAPSAHRGHEPIEHFARIMRSRRRFRVKLEAPESILPVPQSLYCPVVQVEMRDLDASGQGVARDRVVVILRGDRDLLRLEILHRMVRTD